jgi:hypothetical protein
VPKQDDLRVAYSTFEAARGLESKLAALFRRVQPVMFAAETASEVEAALARLTPGQRSVWAVEQLQLEMGNGGIEQYFYNSAGDTAPEALLGLRAIDAPKFARPLEQAIALFPGGKVPRDRDARERLLDEEGLSDVLTDSDVDDAWEDAYAVEEELSKLGLEYVARHRAEFFFD